MTLRQLRDLVAAEPAKNDDLEVKVWIPGSRIRLQQHFARTYRDGQLVGLMIEGNLEPGSALS